MKTVGKHKVKPIRATDPRDSVRNISGRRHPELTSAADVVLPGHPLSDIFRHRRAVAKLALLDNDTKPLEETHEKLALCGASVKRL